MILKTKPIGYYPVNDNLSWTRGSNSGLEITIKNTEDDTQTYNKFTNKVTVDGNVVDLKIVWLQYTENGQVEMTMDDTIPKGSRYWVSTAKIVKWLTKLIA